MVLPLQRSLLIGKGNRFRAYQYNKVINRNNQSNEWGCLYNGAFWLDRAIGVDHINQIESNQSNQSNKYMGLPVPRSLLIG